MADDDFCLTHGFDHMRRRFGHPVAYCEACERPEVYGQSDAAPEADPPDRIFVMPAWTTPSGAPGWGLGIWSQKRSEEHAHWPQREYLLADLQATTLAEKDDEIAKLRAALETTEADRDAEIMAREELSEVAGCEIAKLWAEVSDLLPLQGVIDRLRAGITAAVEGRYERVPHEHDAAFCRHNLQKKAACLCGSCLRAHLLALLGEPGPEDRT